MLISAAVLLAITFPAVGSAVGASAGTRLAISVWPQGLGAGKPVRELTLRCRPAGGTHPTPRRACRRLYSMDNPFAPVPSDMPCVLGAAGPQVAVVRGRFRGARVDARFDRSDSCEARRWARVAFLFAAR